MQGSTTPLLKQGTTSYSRINLETPSDSGSATPIGTPLSTPIPPRHTGHNVLNIIITQHDTNRDLDTEDSANRGSYLGTDFMESLSSGLNTNDKVERFSPRKDSDDEKQKSLSDVPEFNREQKMSAGLQTQQAKEGLGILANTRTTGYGTNQKIEGKDGEKSKQQLNDSDSSNEESSLISLLNIDQEPKNFQEQQQQMTGNLKRDAVLTRSTGSSNGMAPEASSNQLRVIDLDLDPSKRRSGDFSGGLDVEPDIKPIPGPCSVFSNLGLIGGTRILSVGVTTFVREILREYITGSPAALAAGAITALSYPISLNAAGIGLHMHASHVVYQALDELCAGTENAIRQAASKKDIAIDEQELSNLINAFKVKLAAAIEARSKISAKDVTDDISNRINMEELDSYNDLINTLDAKGIFLSTKMMNAIRVFNIILLSGLGITAGCLGMIMPSLGLGPLGLLPALGPTLMSFELWYCPAREGMQLVLPLKDNVYKKKENDEDEETPHFHLVPTLFSSANYVGDQTLVNIAMDAARGMPEYSVVPVINTLTTCAIVAGINTAGEVEDQEFLLDSHNLHGGTEPLVLTVKPEWPSREKLISTGLGVHTGRTTLFAAVVLVSAIVEAVFGLTGIGMAAVGGGVLGGLYWILIMMAVGKIFQLGVR